MGELEAFVLGGSGIVVGLPGVGKTYALDRLDSVLERSGRLRLYIPIDKLDIESENDLQSEIGIEGDIVSYLKGCAAPSSDSPGILLIDAFDAARSTKAQRTLSRLVGRIRRELADSWNVVVSVRTFDARKSCELQELFPRRDETAPSDGFQLEGIHCRHFCIPKLTDDEVDAAAEAIPRLPSICGSGSAEFRDLLRIPFNLWLLEQLLSENADIPELSSAASEVQLLGLFWRHRIMSGPRGDGKSVLLTSIARSMVKQNSLSVRREQAFDFSADDVWNLLFSASILVYTSPSEQRVAFSHNILFDYAVSRLLIQDDPGSFVEFISEDASRPLFLRPSLVHYLTRLWYESPKVFWDAFWHIMPLVDDVHTRLYARLLPPSVIANEALDIEQLQPLIDALQQSRDHAPQALLRVLQAVSMLDVRRDSLWASFLERISNHLSIQFVWNVSSLATAISGRAEPSNDSVVWTTCGKVARNLAVWFWSEMDQQKSEWLTNIGGHWILPLVAKTYATDVSESRANLERALEPVGQEGFPIGLLRAVVQDIDSIYPCDPHFAAGVYVKVFSNVEDSNEPVHMGGRVLSFTSTRRQDYDMCQYWLIEKFPQFLRSAPIVATQTAIACLNVYVVASHIRGYLKEGATLEDLQQEFRFQGTTVHYINDTSFIWDSSGHHDEPTKMADALYTYISELARQPERRDVLISLINLFRNSLCVAFLWRRLLAVASQLPEVFGELLFDLFLARPIQTGSDTIYELGTFLEAAASGLAPDRLRIIEESIVSISEGEDDPSNLRYLVHCRDRLLARIPKELLVTAQAKQLRERMESANDVPENKPLVTFSGFSGGEYNEEMCFREQGIDTASPDNQATELWRIFPKSPELFWTIMEDRAKAEDNQLVTHALLNSLSYVVAQEEDRAVGVLSQVTDRMLPIEFASEIQEASYTGILKEMMPLVVWLVVMRGNSWAEQVIERLFRHPICYAEPIEELASYALQRYVFPNDGPAKDEVVSCAMSLVERAISVASNGVARLRAIPQDQCNDNLTSRMRATNSVIDDTVRLVYFALRVDDRPGRAMREPRDHNEIARDYAVIKPVLKQILDFASDAGQGVMFASTAHMRGDLIGQDASLRWHVVEAKGRSSTPPSELYNEAKDQAKRIATMNGTAPSTWCVSVADLGKTPFRVAFADPQSEDNELDGVEVAITPQEFFRVYYAWFAGFVEAELPLDVVRLPNGPEGLMYVATKIPESRFAVGVEESLFESARSGGNVRRELDELRCNWLGNESVSVGADGFAVFTRQNLENGE